MQLYFFFLEGMDEFNSIVSYNFGIDKHINKKIYILIIHNNKNNTTKNI